MEHLMRSALLAVALFAGGRGALPADEPPRLTTLSDPALRFTIAERGYHVLERSGVRAVIVDNRAVSDQILPEHRAGYSGVASLKHAQQSSNLFVPGYSGLNYEHIHDGTTAERDVLFEPRKAEMQLRVIDAHTVELYQPPTPTWKLESVLRYQMLKDGVLEMTLECIPRADTFRNGYIGLFWASYINQPESLDIHFRGRAANADGAFDWVRGITPRHGVNSTHVGVQDRREFRHDDDFPLSLVFNRSGHVFEQPWYYGVSHGMAFVQMFRPQDQVWLSQSPSGGGQGNPAWDFQYMIPDYKVGQRYQLVMRAMYLPFESAEQIERETRLHRRALGQP